VTAKLVMLGAGGAARELYWFAKDTLPGVEIAFVDDVGTCDSVEIAGESVPVVRDWNFPEGFERFVVGVAEPRIKRILVNKALGAGLVPHETLVHPRAIVRPDCTVGVGGMIVAHSQLTTNATLGDYVLVLDSTIGHHDVVGDYTTCFPGCKVSGDVVLGKDVLLGAGTVIRNRVRIADGVVTGASSCVVADVLEPGVTIAGVPAKPLVR
jgi:sugar O-acyltransferase (sialic acid O-acetyltransferase NeuD family)